MDILDEFYFGNIIPHEHTFWNNAEYKKALTALRTSLEKFEAHLSDENKKLLEAVLDAETDISSVAELESFKLGFRLGVHMMCGCFCGGISDEMLL